MITLESVTRKYGDFTAVDHVSFTAHASICQFLLPTLALILAAEQAWFGHLQPWVDFDFATGALLAGSLTSQQWSQHAVTGLIWLVVPRAVRLRLVVRAEVK
jgi:ABC-2 type transport system permease protein